MDKKFPSITELLNSIRKPLREFEQSEKDQMIVREVRANHHGYTYNVLLHGGKVVSLASIIGIGEDGDPVPYRDSMTVITVLQDWLCVGSLERELNERLVKDARSPDPMPDMFISHDEYQQWMLRCIDRKVNVAIKIFQEQFSRELLLMLRHAALLKDGKIDFVALSQQMAAQMMKDISI